MLYRYSIRFAAAAAAAGLSACASSGFVSSWQAPDAEPLQVQGAKVAAVVMMQDEGSRRDAEDALAREITARGGVGIPSYTVLPRPRFDDEATARAAMESAGVAGAVVMRPVGTRTELAATPSAYTTLSYNRFWGGGYYAFGWASPWVGVAVPVEVHSDTIVSIETLVYSLRQNKLVWAGQTTSRNPPNVDRLVRETAAKVAKELARRGLLSEAG
ncbi:MAG TPA: hypothetical protein VFV10_12035 [Gammaproteobacteria bacterium]|nr:hypothetical protein [Gammaproteobacteria bacterium]